MYKKVIYQVVAVVLLSWLLVSANVGAGAVDKAGIAAAVKGISNYNYGQDRGPLQMLDEVVQQTYGQAELRGCLEDEMIKLLESNATREAKEYVCRTLWMMGTDKSLPVLQKMLVKEETCEMACYALREYKSEAASAALRGALKEVKGRMLIGIINLLGQRGDKEIVGVLKGYVAGADAGLAEAAISALGKIGGKEAAAILKEVRGKGGAMQTAATHGYMQCADVLAKQGMKQESLAIFQELMSKDEYPLTRRGALMGIMRVGGATALPQVMSILRGEDQMLKAAAIANSYWLKGEPVTQQLVAELPKLSASDQVLLIDALAGREIGLVRPAISKAASSNDAAVSSAAYKALGKIGDASSVKLLVGALAKSEGEKNTALASLRKIKGAGVEEALIDSLAGAKAEIQVEIIGVLSDRMVIEAIAALLQEAGSKDEAVAKVAYKTLGKLADAQVLPTLIDKLGKAQSDSVRKEAERAVIAICRKNSDESQQGDVVLKALGDTKDLAKKCSLLRVLGGIANEKSFEALKKELSGKGKVREVALRALAKWPDDRATEVLFDVFRTDENKTHRILSLRGYVRIVGDSTSYSADKKASLYGQAMEQAKRADEKKLILAGLAEVANEKALMTAAPLLDDESVQAEAGLAAVKIAGKMKFSPAVKEAMEKVQAISKDENLRKEAAKILEANAKK